jgi:hypothetical protein
MTPIPWQTKCHKPGLPENLEITIEILMNGESGEPNPYANRIKLYASCDEIV